MLKRQLQLKDAQFSAKQYWTPLEEISPYAIQAIVTSEDGRFMEHRGVDFKELGRMYSSYREGERGLRGCSTITQQVAKNCFTLCSDTFLRKIVELYWASLIEIFWSKERILEVYLNVIEVGKGLYGIEAAAMEYFRCSSGQLTPHDSAALALCLPQPLVLTPIAVWEARGGQVENLVKKVREFNKQ
jgi:monofunctional biosynthetic peptidoglycan transglycosylase